LTRNGEVVSSSKGQEKEKFSGRQGGGGGTLAVAKKNLREVEKVEV